MVYLRTCVSQEILVNIDHKSLRTEKDFLKGQRTYIDSRLHTKVIRHLIKNYHDVIRNA